MRSESKWFNEMIISSAAKLNPNHFEDKRLIQRWFINDGFMILVQLICKPVYPKMNWPNYSCIEIFSLQLRN